MIRNRKQEGRWDESSLPYVIEESLGKGVHQVSNTTTGLILKKGVNQSRLKFHGRYPLYPTKKKSDVGNYNNKHIHDIVQSTESTTHSQSSSLLTE